MITKIPDENDKHEIAGRMYEAVDLQIAIENGNLKTVADVLKTVKQASEGLSKVLNCSKWVYNDNCCLDIQATLNQEQRFELPQKAISIRQPWAWLIVNGIKDVENRNWRTHYRGPVLVHAGKKIEKFAYDYVAEKFNNSIEIPPPEELETGGIVGVTNIIDCLEEVSDYSWHVLGAYGFLLKDSSPLPFMPCKGKLSFFSINYR